ncbi:hypothetical protein HanPI659440_Chr11g0415371 [Helianthus annuus]|nr:hypothetical protein HanPI659440_Chr11g0415371 [Helianthus annuus]
MVFESKRIVVWRFCIFYFSRTHTHWNLAFYISYIAFFYFFPSFFLLLVHNM